MAKRGDTEGHGKSTWSAFSRLPTLVNVTMPLGALGDARLGVELIQRICPVELDTGRSPNHGSDSLIAPLSRRCLQNADYR